MPRDIPALTQRVETKDLRVEKFNIALTLSRELDDMLGSNGALVDFIERDLPRQMARQLVATLKLPTEALQDNRVVASYPDGLWQTIKAALGLEHRRVTLRMNELLVYPTVKVQPPFANSVRLHYTTTPERIIGYAG